MLKELVEIYRVKKANPYRFSNGTFATKDKYDFIVGKESEQAKQVDNNKEKSNKEIQVSKDDLKSIKLKGNPKEFVKVFGDKVTPKEVATSLFGSEKLKGNVDFGFEGVVDNGMLYAENTEIFGAKVKEMQRYFDLKNKEVEHYLLRLEESNQGGGAIKEMYKSAIPLYKKMGMEKITLTANLNAGGYAWAKYGFNLKDAGDAKNLSQKMNDRIEFGMIADYAENDSRIKKELETTKKLLKKYSNDVRLPRIISDIQTPFTDRFLTLRNREAKIKPSLAKHLLMNTEWKGELSFKDKASMDRLNKYINSGSVKKQENQRVSIKKQDAERQVVWGELYAPNRLDSDNEFMSRETLENLQMTIAKSGFKLPVDLDHKNVSQKDAHIVECFIARKGDPDFIEGSLVVGLHIPNKELWNEVKHGRYNGFSIEALVNKQDREVEVEVPDMIIGETKENDGHIHGFTTNLDVVNGKIIFKSGETLPCKTDGHVHKIQRWSATEFANGHNHKLSISDYLKIKE